MGAAAWKFVPTLVGEPGGEWRAATDEDDDTDMPTYGVALVSRVPVAAWRVVRLPPARVRSPVYVPGAGFILLADEPRVAVIAQVGLAGRPEPLLVASTHLSFVPGWNLVQLRRLARAMAALGGPCVILGDLNVPKPFASVAGWRSLVKAKTFPSLGPSMQIDHALGRGDLPPVVGGGSHRLAVSDHLALTVDFATGAFARSG